MSLNIMLSRPVDMELWIILFYVVAVLAGARIVEALARAHFARALRHGEQGFEYVEAFDVYRCPRGEYLSLHNVQQDSRFAVYRAPRASCSQCQLKALCVPSGESRLVFRSLAAWAETNVGIFHRRISVVMSATAVVVSVAGLWRWAGEAGSGWLAGAFLAGGVLTMQELRTIFRGPKQLNMQTGLPEAESSELGSSTAEKRFTRA